MISRPAIERPDPDFQGIEEFKKSIVAFDLGSDRRAVILARRLANRESIAAVAQLVERVLGKDEAMGSSPISSSELIPAVSRLRFTFVRGMKFVRMGRRALYAAANQ